MREKIACIYAIINTVNSRRYVGSTSDAHTRRIGHLSMLRRGVHENSYLQRSWLKYGEDAFVFVVVERCEVSELHVREQYHLDACQPNVYNRGSVAQSPKRGMPWTADQLAAKIGTKASAEAKKHRRIAWARWRAAMPHCRNGHAWTEENTKYAYRKDGTLERRICRACRREISSQKWKNQKAIRGPLPARVITDEYRAKLKSAWQARGGGHWKGQKFSDAHKAKLREAWVRRKARQQEVA